MIAINEMMCFLFLKACDHHKARLQSFKATAVHVSYRKQVASACVSVCRMHNSCLYFRTWFPFVIFWSESNDFTECREFRRYVDHWIAPLVRIDDVADRLTSSRSLYLSRTNSDRGRKNDWINQKLTPQCNFIEMPDDCSATPTKYQFL